MKNFFLTLFLLVLSQTQWAQIRELDRGLNRFNDQPTDSIYDPEISVKLDGKTRYTDYKIINHRYDTTYVDTTLTIQKEYKFNFRRKDNFELLSFHNQGQTFNNLAYNFTNFSLFPDIGFRSKQFLYENIEDMKYYQVPTPTTEILYKTGQEQGQVLDALFTVNFSRRLNLSISYKGLRSLGQYRNSLASTGNFRTSFSYQTPQKQYEIRGHITSQDVTNQESGGLTDEMLGNFLKNDPNFKDRGRLDVNLNNTENLLESNRFYFDHSYKIFVSKDSTNTKNFSNLKVGHEFTYEEKDYNFTQSGITDTFFGKASKTGAVDETTENQKTNNQVYLEFNSKYVLGQFKVKANYTTVSYGYDSIINILNPVDKLKLKGKAISVGGNWRGKIGNFNIDANATIAPGSGYLSGTDFKAEAVYKKDSLFTLKARLNINSKSPNFNFQLLQSTYNDYNWSNNFVNIDTQNIGGTFLSDWINASLDISNIQDYTYFDSSNKPQQYNESITYLKLKANNEFVLGKFALNNTLMYQKVSNGSDVFRVPEFVTRNTLYYTDEWFKGKPVLVNIGVTFKYFTKFKANAYNPLLAEFTLQDSLDIGYPTFDVFFNARVRRTRIFFKVDNVTSDFTKKNYFSAPNYPYRDLSIRFGVVWNWFI